MSTLLPHDLLRVVPNLFAVEPERPEQGAALICALAEAPWVVVRRAKADTPQRQDCIPAGIRGRTRADRFAAWIDPRAVLEVVPPQALRGYTARRALPVFDALYELRHRWAALPLCWGPVGSVGFELASGTPAAHAGSDLDLIVRAEVPLSLAEARDLHFTTLGLAAPTDVQLETPLGAVSLAEFIQNPASLMLRTAAGPRLTRSPWTAIPEPRTTP